MELDNIININSILNIFTSLVILINPLSKVAIIASISSIATKAEVNSTINKSSLIAFFIIFIFSLTGPFILQDIFKIHMYAFSFAGGIILGIRGYEALNKGVFFQLDLYQKISELSIVPLASPLIAGPAVLTAVATYSIKDGKVNTAIASFLAIFINYLFMITSDLILKKVVGNIIGALIRIMGLLVMSIGVQMLFSSVLSFYKLEFSII